MRSLLGCCLFGFLLATGTCLECESCFGMGNNCTGVTRTCAAGENTCVVSLMQAYQAPMTATYVSKTCGLSSACPIGLREVDFGNQVGVRMDSVCCTGDACKKTSAPVLPPLDHTPNGHHCPGCLGLFSVPDCDAITATCTGNNTQCLELAAQISFSAMPMDITVKGCTNAGVCQSFKAGRQVIGGMLVDISVAKCTAASKIEAP